MYMVNNMRMWLSVLLSVWVCTAWAQETETITFSEMGYSNALEVTSVEGTNFSITFNKGTNSNTPKYYTSGAAIRVYGGGYFTVSSNNDITSIVITFGNGDDSNAITTNVGTYSSGSWSGTAKSVKFSVGGTSGNRRIAAVTVTTASSTPRVSTPTFSVADGEVARGTVVNFNCDTEGVTYYYTTDGSDPTAGSASATSYTVNGDVTLKLMAVKAEMDNSAVATASYTILKADPNLAFSQTTVTANYGEAFTAPTLTYADGYDGTITYSSSNAAITVNPTTGEVSFTSTAIDKTTTITATATATDNFKSGTASYVLNVVDPTAITGNLNSTTFGESHSGSAPAGYTATGDIGGVTVTYIRGDNQNAYISTSEIRIYNGTSLKFTAPDGYTLTSLTFDNTVAFSADHGTFSGKTWTASDDDSVTEVTLTRSTGSGGTTLKSVTIHLEQLATAVAAPTITPASGTYTSAQTVSITNNAEGATLYYTTDGTTPTAASTAYTKPFVLSKNGTYTVKAIAIGDEGKSRVVTHTYTIDIDIDAPVFTETDGTTFTEPYTIHLTAADGCHIYYATGSASPVDDMGNLTSSAILYNGGIANISKATTITAVAVDAYGNVSHTATASYKYTGEVEVPFYENFDQGLGNFTVETSGSNAPVWVFRTNDSAADIEKYGEARRYAYVTGNNNKRGTARLISPIIDLSDETVTSATLNFIHAGRYFDGYNSDKTVEQTAAGMAPSHAQLFVREVGGSWQQLTIPNWFTQTGQYTRFNSGDIDLSAFAGKKIQVSFLYTADTQSTGTWNVLKFAVTTTNEEIVNMNTDGYVTYVVKNDIDWSQTKDKYPDVHGYKVTEFGREEAVFVEFGVGSNETMIPAETPIILKGKQGENHLVIAKSDDVISKPKNNLLKPSYGEVKVAAGQQLFVFQKDKDWSAETPYDKYGFYRLSANRLIPERKAYLNAIDATEQVSGKTNMARGVYRLKDMGRLANAILGDVNGDGLVDVNDVMGVVSDVCGEKPDTYIEEAADVNGDEDIDVNDVMKIVDTITDDKQQ